MRFSPLAPALVAASALVLAGCAPSPGSDDSGADGSPVPVAIITSQTGPLAAYGEAYLNGFEAGLDTDGIRAAVQARWPDLLAPRTPLSAAAG